MASDSNKKITVEQKEPTADQLTVSAKKELALPSALRLVATTPVLSSLALAQPAPTQTLKAPGCTGTDKCQAEMKPGGAYVVVNYHWAQTMR